MATKQSKFHEALNLLADRLTNLLLEESTPAGWAGGETPTKDMTSKTRGDRYWDKKNAIATATLLAKIHNLIELNARTQGGRKITSAEDAEAAELASLVRKAQRETKSIVTRIEKTH